MEEKKVHESHKPTEFSFYALVAIFILNAIIVLKLPLHTDAPWWGKVILASIAFFGGGFIYSSAMESVAVILKVVMEAAWAIFLLPVTVGLVFVYDNWGAFVQLAVDLGADKKAAPIVVILGIGIVGFMYSMTMWALMYPLSMVAGTDPRQCYKVS